MAKSIVLILVFALALTTNGTPFSQPTPAQREVLDRLKYDADFETIGQIGSKIFIAYTPLNVALAGPSICDGAGLEFATFKDRTEFDFLYTNTKSDLWISGIMRGKSDENRADAFIWTNGESLPENINFYMPLSQSLCLYVAGDHLTSADLCLGSQHQTLCQLQVG